MNISAQTGKQMVIETLQSGIIPIELEYQNVVFFGKEARMLRTFMVFNSLDLGTLTFKEYRFVARRNSAGYHMVKRHVEKLLRLIPKVMEKHPEIECYALPVFPRLIRDGELISILYDAFALYSEVSPTKLCIEVSADVLYEDLAVVKQRFDELRDLGVKVAISEVGDAYCPLYKLNELQFDMLLLDAFATDLMTNPDAARAAAGLIAYLRTFGVPVIAPELENQQTIEAVKTFECDGYSAAQVATSIDRPEQGEDADDSSTEEAAESAVDDPATDEPPVEETPVEETPVEETPVEDPPVEETPVEETPVEETPVEETPEEETPVEETPVEETPAEDETYVGAIHESPDESPEAEETPEEESEREESMEIPAEEQPTEGETLTEENEREEEPEA